MIYFTTFKVALVLHLKTADFTFSPSYETRLNYITGDPRHLHNSPLDDAFLASTSSVAGVYALSATFFFDAFNNTRSRSNPWWCNITDD